MEPGSIPLFLEVQRMSEELAIAYQRLHALGDSAMRMLPDIAIAVLVFLLFLLAARVTRKPVPSASRSSPLASLPTTSSRTSWPASSSW